MGKGGRRPVNKLIPKGIPELRSVASSKHAKQRGRDGKFTGEDVRRVALEARARHAGKSVPRDEGVELRQTLKNVMPAHMGEDLGRVLERELSHDRRELQRLWQVWTQLCAAERTYRKRILGVTGDPVGSSMLMVAERVATDPDEKPDERTEDEKDQGARDQHQRWQRRLDGLLPGHRAWLVQAESGMGKKLWDGKAPTLVGRQTVVALQKLADLIERER